MSDVKYSVITEDPSESKSSNERRVHLEFVRKDRRVIERLGDPQLRLHAMQIHRLCQWWIRASIAYVVVTVGVHAYSDFHTCQKSIFFGVVILTLTFAVYNVSGAAASYVDTESRARVEKLVEKIYLLLFTAATVSAILGVSYILTLF